MSYRQIDAANKKKVLIFNFENIRSNISIEQPNALKTKSVRIIF